MTPQLQRRDFFGQSDEIPKRLRGALSGVGFQDPQHFCDRLRVLVRAVARRDDVFALGAVHV
jgi:hypothetical protein